MDCIVHGVAKSQTPLSDFTQSLTHDKASTNGKLLLMDEQGKWFFEMETTPGDDVVKIVKETRKDLE